MLLTLIRIILSGVKMSKLKQYIFSLLRSRLLFLLFGLQYCLSINIIDQILILLFIPKPNSMKVLNQIIIFHKINSLRLCFVSTKNGCVALFYRYFRTASSLNMVKQNCFQMVKYASDHLLAINCYCDQLTRR